MPKPVSPLEAYNFLESYEALAGAVEASEECALELPERQGARLNKRVQTLVSNILQRSNRMTQGQSCTQANLEHLFKEGARQVRYWLEACATSAQSASAARDSYNASLAVPDHRLPPATQHPTASTSASQRVRDRAALRLREGPILRGQTHYDSLGLTGAEKVAKALRIPELQGALQMVGGASEAMIGTLILPLGAPIVAHGVDQVTTGAQTFALGRYQPTITERLLHQAGLSQKVAARVDVAASLVSMTGGGVAASLRAGRAAQLSAAVVAVPAPLLPKIRWGNGGMQDPLVMQTQSKVARSAAARMKSSNPPRIIVAEKAATSSVSYQAGLRNGQRFTRWASRGRSITELPSRFPQHLNAFLSSCEVYSFRVEPKRGQALWGNLLFKMVDETTPLVLFKNEIQSAHLTERGISWQLINHRKMAWDQRLSYMLREAERLAVAKGSDTVFIAFDEATLALGHTLRDELMMPRSFTTLSAGVGAPNPLTVVELAVRR